MDGRKTKDCNECGDEQSDPGEYSDHMNDNHPPMVFRTIDEAEDFLKKYASDHGFIIRRFYRSLRTDGEVSSRTWVCNKQGTRDPKHLERTDHKRGPRLLTRFNCSARYKVDHKQGDGKCTMTQFNDNHNHDLTPTSYTHFMSSNREVPEEVMAQSKHMRKAGIEPCKIYRYYAHVTGGFKNIGFLNRDLNNKFRDERSKSSLQDDAKNAVLYMRLKSSADPAFFYRIKQDNEGSLERLIWMDGVSRFDYSRFGDILIMDSTYNTNSYGKPLVLIGGVTNHHKTVLFGFAVVHDEKVDSYKWILSKFLEAMNGKHPESVVTDSDMAMAAAISTTFPEAKHRVCGWHIMEKARARFSYKQGFLSEFSTLVYECMTRDEFELRWVRALEIHELKSNEWLDWMYSRRKFWAAAYIRGYFFAEVRTTQRIEGMNSNVKDGMPGDMQLVELLEHLDTMLNKTRLLQGEAEYRGINGMPTIKTGLTEIEEHARSIFTEESYKKVIEQLKKLQVTRTKYIQEIGCSKRYEVCEYRKPKVWNVVYAEARQEIECECLHFPSFGFPCVHVFEVMKQENMVAIPKSLIKTRWTKLGDEAPYDDLNAVNSTITIPEEEDDRFAMLMKLAIKGVVQAYHNPESCGAAVISLFRLGKKIDDTAAANDPIIKYPGGKPLLNPKISTKKRSKVRNNHQMKKHKTEHEKGKKTKCDSATSEPEVQPSDSTSQPHLQRDVPVYYPHFQFFELCMGDDK